MGMMGMRGVTIQMAGSKRGLNLITYPSLVGCDCNVMDPWKYPRNILSWGLLCIQGARMVLPRRNY